MDRVWRLLFARPPKPADAERSLKFVRDLGASLPVQQKPAAGKGSAGGEVSNEERALAALCQVLMGSNRFLYLD